MSTVAVAATGTLLSRRNGAGVSTVSVSFDREGDMDTELLGDLGIRVAVAASLRQAGGMSRRPRIIERQDVMDIPVAARTVGCFAVLVTSRHSMTSGGVGDHSLGMTIRAINFRKDGIVRDVLDIRMAIRAGESAVNGRTISLTIHVE
jgi:hypothetical protein